MEKILTIFTPTFNRAYTLPRLYESLCNQTSKAFVWLIVDDGSTDNTEKLVQEWGKEDKIQIKYVKQENAGKHIAHNKGVENTDTELFACVDSDDWLVDAAVEKIEKVYMQQSDIVGIVCKRATEIKTITNWDEALRYASLYDAEHNFNLSGDTMLIFRTEIIAKHYFPKFEGEKFTPELYLYDQLISEGVMYFYPEVLYMCEYLPDGYSANMREVNAKNPNGYLAFIQQRLRIDKKIFYKMTDTIRYIAIKCVQKDGRILKDAVYPGLTVMLYGAGWIFYRKVYYKFIGTR